MTVLCTDVVKAATTYNYSNYKMRKKKEGKKTSLFGFVFSWLSPPEI